MLDPFSRGTMVALLALCVAGTIGLAPLRARSSSEPGRAFTAATLPYTPVSSAGEAVVMRDPFAEPTPVPATPIAPSLPNGHSVSGGLSPLAAPVASDDSSALPALPSNLAHDTIPVVPGSTPELGAEGTRVTAIVTGAHPYAMLETDGVHSLKGIGDRLRGVAITAIDISGVTLQTGQRLHVDEAGRP